MKSKNPQENSPVHCCFLLTNIIPYFFRRTSVLQLGKYVQNCWKQMSDRESHRQEDWRWKESEIRGYSMYYSVTTYVAYISDLIWIINTRTQDTTDIYLKEKMLTAAAIRLQASFTLHPKSDDPTRHVTSINPNIHLTTKGRKEEMRRFILRKQQEPDSVNGLRAAPVSPRTL
jgi:hypothetical protein